MWNISEWKRHAFQSDLSSSPPGGGRLSDHGNVFFDRHRTRRYADRDLCRGGPGWPPRDRHRNPRNTRLEGRGCLEYNRGIGVRGCPGRLSLDGVRAMLKALEMKGSAELSRYKVPPRYKFPQEVDGVGGLETPPMVFRALYIDGVPEEFDIMYQVGPTLSTLFPDGSDPVILFGDNGDRQPVGVEVKSGHVVYIVNVEDDVRTFVNSNID